MCGSDITGITGTGMLAVTGSLAFGWGFAAGIVLLVVGFVIVRMAFQREQARAAAVGQDG